MNTATETERRSTRRKRSAVLLLGICGVLSAGGAVLAWRAGRDNAPRAAVYAADPVCRIAPATSMVDTLPPSACSFSRAIVTAQYVHANRGSRYYRLALRTPDGLVDSVETTGPNGAAIWTASPFGAFVAVQRFIEPGARTQHVTIVSANGLTARTKWNPEWQASNTQFGTWFLGIVAACFALALAFVGVRRNTRPR